MAGFNSILNNFKGGLGLLGSSSTKTKSDLESYPGLTKEEKEKLTKYVQSKYSNKTQQNAEALKIYNQWIQKKSQDKFSEDRQTATQHLINKSSNITDPVQKQQCITQASQGGVANILRDYARTQGKDMRGVDDQQLIMTYLKSNPKAQKGFKDVINGKGDVCKWAIENGLMEDSTIDNSTRGVRSIVGKGDLVGNQGSMSTLIDRNGREINDDVLGHFDTNSYEEAGDGFWNKAGTFIGNAAKSTYNLGSDIVNMVANPLDTVNGLAKTAVGAAMNATGSDDYINNLSDSKIKDWLASANQVADGAGEYLLERYGGIDNVANSLYQDPAGVISDIAGLVSGGASLVKGGAKAAAKAAAKAGAKGAANTLDDVARVSGKVSNVANAVDPATYINKGISKVENQAKNLSENIKNISELGRNVKAKAQTMADDIVQNNNRMTKKQQENFKKMSGKDQGTRMNERDLRNGDDVLDYFQESKQKVDNAMEAIDGRFTSSELTDVLNDSTDFAGRTKNKQYNRLKELQKKNANGGLSMPEINEVKRFYESNNKFNYLKEGTAEKSALTTNMDSALREWQMKIAEENGLTNLKELNKETQAAKFIADNSIAWDSGIKGNNPISITDWIVGAGGGVSPESIASIVGKKVIDSKWFKNKLVDVLNYLGGHEGGFRVNADMGAIAEKNQLKISEKIALMEELKKVKNEKQFNDWLKAAEELSNQHALGYNPDVRNYNTIGVSESTPIVSDSRGNAWRQGQIADISK